MDALINYINALKKKENEESKLREESKKIFIRCNKRINRPLLSIAICLQCMDKDKCLDFIKAKLNI